MMMMMVIARSNYTSMRAYLQYQHDVMQRDPQTVERTEKYLKHVLRWADDRPLEIAPDLRPTLPRYLASIEMTPRGITRTCMAARAWFTWLRQEDAQRFKRLTERFIQTIQPAPAGAEQPHDHEVVTLEMVRKLIAVPVADDDIATWRDQAAAAFLFLSGCRASAFATLPLDCIDIASRSVKQLPTRGVHTKRHKAAITRLLEIPDLLAVCERWDGYVRERLPVSAPWFSVINIVNGEQHLVSDAPGENRRVTLRQRMVKLFRLAGLAPMSPHKFRHGHAVYAMTLARDMADFKAISQNLMHANLGVTDGIYGMLPDADAAQLIAHLGQKSPLTGLSGSEEDIRRLVAMAVEETLRSREK